MADRFVLVSTRKWRDPWYRSLSLVEKQVWNYLTEYPEETHTGIFERLIDDIAYDLQMETSSLQGALERLVRDGRLMVEGENYFFVVKWLRHQLRKDDIKPADNRATGANAELVRLQAKCPGLVAACCEFYKGLTSPLEGASLQDKTGTRQEQDRTVETPATPDVSPPSQIAGNKTKPLSQIQLAQQSLIPLATELKLLIDSYDVGGDQVHANQPEKSVVVMELLVRECGILVDQFKPVLQHCLDDEFWSKLCRSISQWKKPSERNGRPKFVNMRDSWLQARRGPIFPGSSGPAYGNGRPSRDDEVPEIRMYVPPEKRGVV